MQNPTKHIGALLAAFLLTACQTGSPDTSLKGETAPTTAAISDDGNVIVLVATEQAANTLVVNAARRGYQLADRQTLDGLNLIMMDFVRPRGVSGAIAISDMRTMEPSATAGIDHLYALQNTQPTSNPPIADRRLYASSMVAWPAEGCRALRTVGLIDSRIDRTRPTLASADIISRDFSGGATEAVQHGTAIADILVGPGRLNGARLYSASVINTAATGQTGAGVFELIRAIDWMHTSGVSLVNISLAGPYNLLLDRAIKKATNDGMVIIAAVGNDGPQAEPLYPAAFRNVIAVTAVDQERKIYDKAIRGDHVDFSAPGVDVFIGDGTGGRYLSGTSVAAPFVTAIIASEATLATASDARAVRDAISDNTVDLGLAGRDPVFGTGLIRTGRSCAMTTNR